MPTNARPSLWKKLGLTSALLLGVGLFAGFGSYFGSRAASTTQETKPFEIPMELRAGTSSRTDSLSMATGLIDNNVEGLWVLDHLTGNLQCWVLGPRTGAVGAIYATNITKDLGIGRAGEAELMMVTGNFLWDGGNTGNNIPGQSICYVGDAKTGNVVGYGVLYNRQDIKRGNLQAGPLRLVCQGKARMTQTERDQ